MSAAAGVLAAAGSAACFGAASAAQHTAASRGPSAGSLDPRLLPRLIRQPLWLVGGAVELAAVGLQLLALRWAAVALVQPLLVLGLPVAVLIAARSKRQPIPRGEWAGLLACAVGVGVVATALPETHDASVTSSGTAGWWMSGVLAAVVAACSVPRRSSLVAGAGAGISAGVGAAALAVCGGDLTHPGHLVTGWAPYVAVIGGVLALQLGQAAFQDDRLGAPLAVVTVTEPVTAIALSAAVLGEPLAGEVAARVTAAVGVLVAVLGVVLVVRNRQR